MAYLTTPNPITGATTAVQAGLAVPPGLPHYNNPPTTEMLMQMIFDTQQTISTLTVAVGELAAHVQNFV